MPRPRPRQRAKRVSALRVPSRNIVTVRHSAIGKTVDVHHKDGRPLQAGELAEGDEITIDMRTGEVLAIWKKRRPKT